jgi:hypothetical protein
LAICKGNQTVVGDGHAMGIASQILKHKLWATEGAFRIDDPIFSEQRSQPRREHLRLNERLQTSVEIELAILEGAFESCNKLAPKNTPEHFNWKKERAL